LINDLLDLAKLGANKMQLVRQLTELAKMIEETLKTFNAWASTKQLRLTTEIQENLPPTDIDANRMIQVIINLISNAIKFTPEGGTITVKALASKDGATQIRVEDTGPGIPQE